MAERALPPLLLILLLAGCPRPASGPEAPAPSQTAPTPPPPAGDADPAACCAWCLAATRRDPAAEDLSLVPCADYVAAPPGGLEAPAPACGPWFQRGRRLVQDCR